MSYKTRCIDYFFRTGSDWFRVYPYGMRRILNWIKRSYGNIPIYITENGVTDRNATLQDVHRVQFYQDYINELMKGMWKYFLW